MKQQLWMVNSSLLAILIVTLLLGVALQQSPPAFQKKRIHIEERPIKTELPPESIENIYKYDLFETYAKKEFVPSLKSLVTPIPQPKTVTIPVPQEPQRPSFIPPLNITVQGVVFSPSEEKSITMIIDETRKETMHHVGDIIKDAQIIKIGKTSITLLRANGQHETISLRKQEVPETHDLDKKWNSVVKKVKDDTFEIDIKQFPKQIPSLGTLTEMLSMLTAYNAGKPIGIKLASLAPDGIGELLGLKQNDIITAIDDIQTANIKNRITAYDSIIKKQTGDSITINLKRGQQALNLNYKLTEIKPIEKKEFVPNAKPSDPHKKEAVVFKLSKLQQREQERREFAKKHSQRQNQAIEEIRKRLLENIRARVRNTRTR
ncbi:hypothetical protein KKA53_02550 [Candidatus Dependentiae bacterium]|nr:hypothetical protein [Candidatus Dependentiae bacterium]